MIRAAACVASVLLVASLVGHVAIPQAGQTADVAGVSSTCEASQTSTVIWQRLVARNPRPADCDYHHIATTSSFQRVRHLITELNRQMYPVAVSPDQVTWTSSAISHLDAARCRFVDRSNPDALTDTTSTPYAILVCPDGIIP